MKENRQISHHHQSGQSLIEYSLIVVLVIISFALALAATGPVLGNIFSNTIYNLVGADRVAMMGQSELPAPNEFWATVTWVANQTPQERALATRTQAPPTFTPTDGPSPTPTPVTPTATYTVTPTSPPSPTPEDFLFDMPWNDSADDAAFWRLDDTFFLSGDDWYGQYYNNRSLTGPPIASMYNAEINPEYFGNLDFDWGSGSAVNGQQNDDFSIEWRRNIYLETQSTLQFDIPTTNNGVRVWILGQSTDGSVIYGGNTDIKSGGPGNCSSQTIDGSPAVSGGMGVHKNSRGGGDWNDWYLFDDDHFGFDPAQPVGPGNQIPDECLIIDRWVHGDESGITNVRRTVPAGIYTLQVEYYEESSTAKLTVDISSPSTSVNPDNTAIDTAGNALAADGDCDWGNVEDDAQSNSLDYMWTEGTQSRGNRCYLELRGAVRIPATADAPGLTFWDVWDLRSGSFGWVEVARYDTDNDGIPDRDPNGDGDTSDSTVVWDRIDVHGGDTYNYNWTYQYVDLSAYKGEKVSIRFALEVRSSTSNNRWWVDTIDIRETSHDDIYTALEWTLDSEDQLDDFILSGHWDLNNYHTFGGSGMALHESPGRDYRPLWNARNKDTTDDNVRMHTIEFKGFVNLDDVRGATDLDGDQGDPLLTFWHLYDLDNYAGLEVQYSTDPYSAGDAATWQVVQGGDLIQRSQTDKPEIELMEEVKINLTTIGVNRFRLRLAMTLREDTNGDPGWWVDEIRLEREGRPRFTRFPFLDRAEDPTDLSSWETLGGWDRVEGGRRPAAGSTGWSYNESPTGDYEGNREYVFQLAYPIDMNLDTPENVNSAACTLGALCEDVDVAPVDPYMTFWWRRLLAYGEDFYIEWKRTEEPSDQWRVLWVYLDQMETDGSSNRSATRESEDWERVEVDFTPIMENLAANDDPGSVYEDDIQLRFRLSTSNSTSSNSDGIFLDDIEIKERVVDEWHLWTRDETRTDLAGDSILDALGNAAFGDGVRYYDSVDNNTEVFTGGWHFGGEWNVIEWEQNSGLYGFHDSPVGQTNAPVNSPDVVDTKHDTFNVLEMNKIIDLRGVTALERPMLYFWHRYAIGSSDRISVQIAYQDDRYISNPECRDGYTQCYEHLYGWSEWEEVWYEDHKDRNYTWHRTVIPLSSYAASATEDGKRIRLRFVLDALDNSDNWDGWYIDDITFKHYDDRPIVISNQGSGGSFFDPARNLNNWITEGDWGLSPEFFRGAGGGPTSLVVGGSIWNYGIWDDPCSGDFRNCVGNFFDTDPDVATADFPGLAIDINNDWGNSGPFGLRNRFAGRWILETGIVGQVQTPGEYAMITASDDGVRLKYETISGTHVVDPGWNIIDNWTYHGRTIDMGVANLVAGNQYRFTLEYFESSGSAVLSLSTGSNNFSFTDSPKQGRGVEFDEIPTKAYSKSALILDGAFDLTNATAPIIQYYTYYENDGGDSDVEVTLDGGFTWTQEGLKGNVPASLWDGPWKAEYWNDMDLDFTGSDTPELTQDVGDKIDFNFGSSSPAVGIDNNGFSIRFTRDITLSAPRTFEFRTRSDDGVRLWLDYDPLGCYDGDYDSVRFSGESGTKNKEFDDDDGGCLLIDNWKNQGPNTESVKRTIPAGTHTLQLDYYENTGGAVIQLDIFPDEFDNPSYGGTYMKDDGDWRLKTHDLSAYAGQPAVGLRFVLTHNDAATNEGTQSPINWLRSWWVVDITVVDP